MTYVVKSAWISIPFQTIFCDSQLSHVSFTHLKRDIKNSIASLDQIQKRNNSILASSIDHCTHPRKFYLTFYFYKFYFGISSSKTKLKPIYKNPIIIYYSHIFKGLELSLPSLSKAFQPAVFQDSQGCTDTFVSVPSPEHSFFR